MKNVARQSPRRSLLPTMLGPRACRISLEVSGGGRPRGSQKSTAVNKEEAKLTTQQRIARWGTVSTKLLWVLRNFEMKRATQAVLGVAACRRNFQQAGRAQSSGTRAVQITDGELVGRKMTPSKGTPSADAGSCTHPTAEMKRRGSKHEKCWACNLCMSR